MLRKGKLSLEIVKVALTPVECSPQVLGLFPDLIPPSPTLLSQFYRLSEQEGQHCLRVSLYTATALETGCVRPLAAQKPTCACTVFSAWRLHCVFAGCLHCVFCLAPAVRPCSELLTALTTAVVPQKFPASKLHYTKMLTGAEPWPMRPLMVRKLACAWIMTSRLSPLPCACSGMPPLLLSKVVGIYCNLRGHVCGMLQCHASL